jgi:hypothetical protein
MLSTIILKFIYIYMVFTFLQTKTETAQYAVPGKAKLIAYFPGP